MLARQCREGLYAMTTSLYETDFYAWTLRQAELLKHEDFAALDLPNLVEELEGMARNGQQALENRLRVLLTHLLKLSYPMVTRLAVGVWRFVSKGGGLICCSKLAPVCAESYRRMSIMLMPRPVKMRLMRLRF